MLRHPGADRGRGTRRLVEQEEPTKVVFGGGVTTPDPVTHVIVEVGVDVPRSRLSDRREEPRRRIRSLPRELPQEVPQYWTLGNAREAVVHEVDTDPRLRFDQVHTQYSVASLRPQEYTTLRCRFYYSRARAFLRGCVPVFPVAESPERLGYTRVPVVSSARAVYGKIEPGRGNLVLVFESTEQLAALRRTGPQGLITPQQTRGVPYASPTTSVTERAGGLTENRAMLTEVPSLREQRMRLARGAPFSAPGVLELPLNVPPRPVQATRAEREEYSTLVVPAEVLQALREYYASRGAARVTQAEAINAASYAVFTAKLRSIPTGVSVTPYPEVGSPRWVLSQIAVSEYGTRGVSGESLVPGRFPESWTPPNIPGEIPVTYSVVTATLFFVHGALYLRRENFANIMRDQLGWHPCGTVGAFALPRTGMYLPATSEVVWCPPPRSFPIAPPASAQRRFETGPPGFAQHARPRTHLSPAPPPRYRRFQ